MLSAGIILVIVGLFADRKNMIQIWKEKSAVLQLLLFSIFGIMLCQLSYLKAISYSNSGTATILQYTGPVMIMIFSCLVSKRLPTKKEIIAIIMALLGTFFIATHGDLSNMVITPKGLSWGIFSAVALATYTLIPQKIIASYGSIAVTGYGMVIGGAVLSVFSKAWELDFAQDMRLYLSFSAIVIFGTVLSFSMFLVGVNRIGPVKASMIASIEPVAATLFMVLWLKEPFHSMELVGFMCIFVTIFLLLQKEQVKEEEETGSGEKECSAAKASEG